MRLRDSQDRAELLFSLAAILAYVTVMSGITNGPADSRMRLRHLIPILPLFAIPLSRFCRNAASVWMGTDRSRDRAAPGRGVSPLGLPGGVR